MAPSAGRRQRRMSREEVVDALSLKREALDREVEEFKRLKEVEFWKYEEELKKQAEDAESQASSENEDTNKKEEELAAHTEEPERLLYTYAKNVRTEREQSGPTTSQVDQFSEPAANASTNKAPPGVRSEAGLSSASGDKPTSEEETQVSAQSDKNLSPRSVPTGSGETGKSRLRGRQDVHRDNGGSQQVAPVSKRQEEAKLEQARPETQDSKPERSEDRHQDSFMEVNGGQHPLSKEDRELELRAFFIPAFLPLLEEPSHRHYLSDGDLSVAESSRNTHHSSKHGRHHSDTSKFSSSLTAFPLLSNNNVEASSISSSQPRLGIADRRSSSSPTGTGRTLRSSLRSPDHPQRERKHVLFSIDNRVISPSTSPAATRSLGPRAANGQRTPPIPFSGLKDFPFPEMKASEPANPPPRPSHISIAGPGTVMSPSTTSPTRFPRSYKDLVEPTVTTPPDESDLNLEASNPMFDLDDQENGGNEAPSFDGEDWGASGRVGEGVEAAEATEEEIAADLAASPHAGSLPIEIKWSGRKIP